MMGSLFERSQFLAHWGGDYQSGEYPRIYLEVDTSWIPSF